MTQSKPGKIYIVATPIGNLEDLSPRACRVLAEVDVIAAEDTRHTGILCRHFAIDCRFVSLHDFNEHARVDGLLQRVEQGESVAVVSDAGTPLISDPGFLLVRAARERGLDVTPVPGPCAFVAALSVAGLPGNRFAFEGFLPAKKGARKNSLEALKAEQRTLIFYESPHRIRGLLNDIASVFPERSVVVARELTKTYETVLSGVAAEIIGLMDQDANQLKGEFVVLLAGSQGAKSQCPTLDIDKLLRLLVAELPTAKAAGIVAGVSQYSKKELYTRALAIRGDQDR